MLPPNNSQHQGWHVHFKRRPQGSQPKPTNKTYPPVIYITQLDGKWTRIFRGISTVFPIENWWIFQGSVILGNFREGPAVSQGLVTRTWPWNTSDSKCLDLWVHWSAVWLALLLGRHKILHGNVGGRTFLVVAILLFWGETIYNKRGLKMVRYCGRNS